MLPQARGREIGTRAIAIRWGFSGAAHFPRVFRTAYGMPPGGYRHQACLVTE
ncbi:hypothetical protein STRIP9103_03342 [Streptomyces ipomoeae 91-03]|uniref:HTH araC/xylS-type domain-containing protein n=1 Tax=Streptomyces ipomoeae 91-03 TaxID=698759 RepID=L1KZS0_9ACTN|nr:hypothetical protein STRIP9103_03342 [Streptomyces ipomoeae 91-03]